MDTLDKIKKDPALRQAYSANIAMAFKDEHARYKKKMGKRSLNNADIHLVANAAAESFLHLLVDDPKYIKGR